MAFWTSIAVATIELALEHMIISMFIKATKQIYIKSYIKKVFGPVTQPAAWRLSAPEEFEDANLCIVSFSARPTNFRITTNQPASSAPTCWADPEGARAGTAAGQCPPKKRLGGKRHQQEPRQLGGRGGPNWRGSCAAVAPRFAGPARSWRAVAEVPQHIWLFIGRLKNRQTCWSLTNIRRTGSSNGNGTDSATSASVLALKAGLAAAGNMVIQTLLNKPNALCTAAELAAKAAIKTLKY